MKNERYREKEGMVGERRKGERRYEKKEELRDGGLFERERGGREKDSVVNCVFCRVDSIYIIEWPLFGSAPTKSRAVSKIHLCFFGRAYRRILSVVCPCVLRHRFEI